MSDIEIKFKCHDIDIVFNGCSLSFIFNTQTLLIVDESELDEFFNRMDIIKKVYKLIGEKSG